MNGNRKPLLLAALAGIAGCRGDQGLHPLLAGPGSAKVAPRIEVEPATLDFGSLQIGQVATREVTIRNAGPEESVLEVSSLGFSGTESYSFVDRPGEFRLPGGQSRTVEVTFSPIQAWGHPATLAVTSDDPMSPVVPVPMDGQGLVPVLEIEPDPLDLGERPVGCPSVDHITLTNVGSFDLEVLELTQTGTAFTISGPDIPLVLDPGESTDLDVTFLPTVEGAQDSVLTVRSTELIGERSATQYGVGLGRAEVHDHFQVPTNGAADILFFVDQSGSMDDDHAALTENFASFIDRLSLTSPDWRILVANGDDGCTNSGILTPETPNYQAIFERAVAQGGGVYTEAGLYVSALAMEQTGPGGCNEGFGRQDALLHVIAVSDEPDQSPETWDKYLERLRATRTDGRLLRFSAVVGDEPDGCHTSRNDAEPGTGYVETSEATGGLFLSICSPWSENVGALADVHVTLDTVRLTQPADPATIRVVVDGLPITSGWSYDTATQSIVFSLSQLPQEGSQIDVTYSPPIACE